MSNSRMFFKGFSENEDIIDIDANDAFHDQILEDFIHHGLESGRAIS